MILLVRDEHLRFVLHPPESGGMDDPVAIALKGSAQRMFILRVDSAPRFR